MSKINQLWNYGKHLEVACSWTDACLQAEKLDRDGRVAKMWLSKVYHEHELQR